MAVGPLVTHALTVLGPDLVESLGLSATQFGALWFVAFGAAGLLAIQGGKLTDRLGARPLVLGVFLSSLAALLTVGFARSYLWLMLAAALGGLAQAMSNPVTNYLVFTSVPRSSQGLALGIKQCGVQIGQFAVGLLLPTIVLRLGREFGGGIFAAAAAVGILLAFRLVPRAARRSPGSTRSAGRQRLPSGLVPLVLVAFVAGAVNLQINAYLPLYANQALGTPVARAGLIVALVGALGTASRMFWGRVGDRIVDPRRPLQWVAGAGALAAVSLLAATWVGEAMIWLGAVIFSATALGANVLIMLVVVRAVPGRSIGHASGWVSSGLYAGFMAGPVAFGAVVDATSGFVVSWALTAAYTLGLWLFVAVWRRARPWQPGPAEEEPPPTAATTEGGPATRRAAAAD
jgi:nitrate/nitrite transporter NarK